MGSFKFRENPSAPWQELTVIGDIYTEGVRPGGSSGAYEVIVINNSARDSTNTFCWLDYGNYITNLDDIEFLTLSYSGSTTIFDKRIMGERTADNKFPIYTLNYNSSSGVATIEDRTSYAYMQFVEGSGVRFSYSGGDSFLTVPSRGACIYCVLKKEA